MTAISPEPRRNASPRATASAASTLGATTTPGTAKSGSRLTTMLVRPLSGAPIDRKVLRPITTGLPMVTLRKCASSDLSRHGSRPSEPMTSLSATATTRVISDRRCDLRREGLPPPLRSHRHLGLDVRMRLVADEREVLERKREDVGHRRIEPHVRQRARRARQLQPRLLEMIEIEVRVAERVDEFAGRKPVTCATISVSSA